MMTIHRRSLVSGAVALAAASSVAGPASARETSGMYGLIGKFSATPGKRDELIEILLGHEDGMPGCLSYVVFKDPQDADAVWISEVWTDSAAHQASLSIPSVKEAIAKARPIIASFGEHHELEPVGGIGLAG